MSAPQIPVIAYRKVVSTKKNTKSTVSVFIRDDIYIIVEALPDNTFVASNGFLIGCSDRFRNDLNNDLLKLDYLGKNRIYFFSEAAVEARRLRQALREVSGLQNTAFDGWDQFGGSTEPFIGMRTGCKIEDIKETVKMTEFNLFLQDDIYIWVYEKALKKFTASNGFEIKCLPNCSPEYDRYNCHLWLNSSFIGNPVDLSSYLSNDDFQDLESDEAKLRVALTEMKEAFIKSEGVKTVSAPDFSDWVTL